MNCFEHEAATLKTQLCWHRTIGIIGGILTFGIFQNRAKITRLLAMLSAAQTKASDFTELCADAKVLSEESKTITIKGHRVSAHTFADIPVISTQDYGVDWEALRMIVLERDSFECCEWNGYCCGPLQVHHIIPLSRGGTNQLENLITLCRYHHMLKHTHMQRSQCANPRR